MYGFIGRTMQMSAGRDKPTSNHIHQCASPFIQALACNDEVRSWCTSVALQKICGHTRPRSPRQMVWELGSQCVLVVVYACAQLCPLAIRSPKAHVNAGCKQGLSHSFLGHLNEAKPSLMQACCCYYNWNALSDITNREEAEEAGV